MTLTRPISERHAQAFRAAAATSTTPLEDHIEAAIIEALDSIDKAGLASALAQSERDREGWLVAHNAKAECLRDTLAQLKAAELEVDALKKLVRGEA